MYIRDADGLGQAAGAATIHNADSSLVKQVNPAALCGVWRSGGNLKVRGWPDITHVVIHTLIGSAATTIRHWHGGQNCFPPHYVINKNGEITQMVTESYYAQHAGTANTYSIGIEHEGGCTNTPACFSESLYQASSALVRDICERQKIPKDREHIIGHDEVPGTDHGDPGGYWDWDYYMALLQWDGRTASQQPQRIVLDYNSLFTFPLTANWQEGTRLPVRWGPGHEQSYAAKYYYATADATAKDDDVIQYEGIIPDSGRWTVSAWWPVLRGNNPAAHIDVATTNREPAQRSFSAVYDQSARGLMARRTVALPSTHTWMVVHTFTLNAGDGVRIQVSRRSSKRGQVVADAFRLLKT
jgi:N-acetylmuramoyl-L-alanine amidase-like protein